MLHVDGVDLRQTPLRTRKQVLTRLLEPSAFVQVLAAIDAPPRRVFDSLVAQGFEGVVAKRADRPYRSGKRSADWIKVKAQQTEEFVVGGFRQGNGGRTSTFGALLVGQFRADGSLGYMGRVGSGFREEVLVAMRAQLDQLVVDENPFSAEPPDAKLTTYVRHELVLELKYAEVTWAGQVRAPVFLRERTDKSPHDVVAAAHDGGAALSTASSVPASDAGDASLLAQIEAGRGDTTLTIGGDSLKVTNLDKEMWPASGDLPPVTKRDLLTYFAKMGGVIVPHVANRPLTLTRYPNGVAGKSFYQKQWTQTMPPFVTPVALWTDENSADGDYLLCNNVPTLLWLGNLADLTLHVSLARTVPEPEGASASTTFGGSKSQIEKSLLNYPDFLLFDLDPFIPEEGETSVQKNALTRAGFEQTRRVALWLKELLDSAGLRSFVKTSGASDIHIFVPIVRKLTYDVVRAVCNAIAGALVATHPKEVTTQFDKTKRIGKVYIDVNQIGRIKSLAAIYSPRANPGAPVSMQLRWDEVAQADPLTYNIWTAPDRVTAVGDIWAGILEAKQDVRSLVDL